NGDKPPNMPPFRKHNSYNKQKCDDGSAIIRCCNGLCTPVRSGVRCQLIGLLLVAYAYQGFICFTFAILNKIILAAASVKIWNQQGHGFSDSIAVSKGFIAVHAAFLLRMGLFG